MKAAIFVMTVFKCSFVLGQIPCNNGEASGYPCKNVTLLSKLTPQELMADNFGDNFINDLWGWTDPETNKEYVLVGMANGTSFIDISDPVNATLLGWLPEHAVAIANSRFTESRGLTAWRDVKVYHNHAFIVSEENSQGMQIFDLTQLRNVSAPPEKFEETAHYDGVTSAHNLAINEETGFAYIVGSASNSLCSFGGLHVVDIRDPLNPTFAGCFSEDGYVHDAQCVIYNGPDADYQGREVCFASNESAFTIVDVDNKQDMSIISRNKYNTVGYVHQGWLTEDQQHFLSNDEADEVTWSLNTTTYIWDISDLDAPTLVAPYQHQTQSIDHNLYIKGGLVYQSNYTAGLRILDMSAITAGGLTEVGYFDTHPEDNATTFNGSWSNYPFFESGVVAVTDVIEGLFILRPDDQALILGADDPIKDVQIYPNPAKDRIHVSMDNWSHDAQYEIIDTSGKPVLFGAIRVNEMTIDISSLIQGIYLLKLHEGQKIIMKKIVIKK